MLSKIPIASQVHDTTQLFSFITRKLVDQESAITVEFTETPEGTVTFHVRCASEDVGKLIGKQGRTARSLRTILAAMSVKHGARYSLDLGEC